MGSFGPLEIILIFLVVLLIFGAKRIPEIARGIGKGIREFKDATGEISRELEAEGHDREINQPQSPQQGQPQARQSQQRQSQQQQASPQSSPDPSASGDASDEPSTSDAPDDPQKTT
jgi:twin arginine-targeting protein translocase, TatA/E family